jgi:hypothetical protein
MSKPGFAEEFLSAFSTVESSLPVTSEAVASGDATDAQVTCDTANFPGASFSRLSMIPMRRALALAIKKLCQRIFQREIVGSVSTEIPSAVNG